MSHMICKMAAQKPKERLSNMSRDEILLEGEFQLFPNEKITYQVELSRAGITFYPKNEGKPGKSTKYLHFGDIIGCRCRKSVEQKHVNTAYITVFAYPLRKKMFSDKRTRHKSHVTFGRLADSTFDKNRKVVETWRRVILHMVQKVPLGKQDVNNCPVPPKTRLLVLVNPHSGPGKAMQIYKKQVAPMLDEADIQVKMIETDHAGHAREIMKDFNRSEYYGVVIVSGDGLIFEVINGMMERSDWQDAVKIPVGCIPGGSGNALCCSINYSAGESVTTEAVLHSTFILIKHRVVPMDLVIVEQPSVQMFSFLSICWGLLADIDFESEKFRAIGEARFTLQALRRIIGLRKYRGKISFLPITDYSPKSSTDWNKKSIGISGKNRRVSLHSLDDSACTPDNNDAEERMRSTSVPTSLFKGGSIDSPSEDFEEQLTDCRDISTSVSSNSLSINSNNYVHLTPGQVNGLNGSDTSTQNGDRNDNCVEPVNGDGGKLSMSSSFSAASGSADSLQVTMRMTKRPGEQVPTHLLPPLDEPVPSDWVTIEGSFVNFCAIYQTHLGSTTIMAPEARFNDGIIHMNIIREGITRNDLLNLMSALEKGSHVDFESPYFEIVKVLAFRLEPEVSTGNIMVDGEKVDCAPLQAQILPGLANLMAIQ